MQGCNLPGAWKGREDFTVGELGFGSGLNVLALWQLWRDHRPSPNARLHSISIEGYPLSKGELQTALEPWTELKDLSAELIAKWPGRVKDWHSLELSDGVSLTLIHDEVMPALDALTIEADAWFLDGFSPAKNPDMWNNEVLAHIGRLSAPGARIGTFTVAGAVRRGLTAAGFDVNKQPGFGKKRERLEAIKPGSPTIKTRPEKIAIIGAGIAAAMTANALLRQGITPTIIAPEDDTLASGNPLATVKPRVDLQDRPEARFFNSAYLYALQSYGDDVTTQTGIYHIAKDEKDAARWQQLIAQSALPPEHMIWLNPFVFEEAANLPAPYGGVLLAKSKIIRPPQITRSILSQCPRIKDKIVAIDEDKLVGEHTTYGPFDQIIYCIGAGVKSLMPDLALRFQHGQVTQARSSLTVPVTYGGYAIPDDGTAWIGATHGRWDGKRPEKHSENDEKNLNGFQAKGGQTEDIMFSRASVRVTTQNTLPRIARLDERSVIISGLGGRGFTYAPLLGAQAAAMALGTPEPVSTVAFSKFSF